MKETRIPNLNVDPVGKRLERIVAEKKTANDEAMGKIKSLTDSWEAMNKTLEADIKHEFELMDLEGQAVTEALGDLEENRTKPVKDAFTLAGKVLSEKENIGLPNVTVVVLQRFGKKTGPLTKGTTDNLGNFVFLLGQDTFGDEDRAKIEVEYQVVAGDGILLHSELQSIAPRLGGIMRVTLAVAETDVVSDQLEAGKAVRDSILYSRDLIASRVENMRGAHDALAKMTGIAREELDTLHEALAVTPPEVIGVITKSKSPKDEKPEKETPKPLKVEKPEKEKPRSPKDEKPEEETPRPPKDERPEKEKPGRPGRKVTGLAAINGIGPQQVKKLKMAKIMDIKTFVATDNRKLTEILGELDFKTMKNEARVLLKKK